MKKTCLWLVIVFVLLLIQAVTVTAYAQQASASATILIIIPERPQHSAQVTEAVNEEEQPLPEETHSEEETALLAKEEKD